MGAGRFVCTAIPFLLSIGCLVTLVLVFVGDTSSLHEFYFFSVNKADFRYASEVNTADWYTLGLWNYCSGPSDHSMSNPTYCSPKTFEYNFDPLTVWNLNGTSYSGIIGDTDSYTDGIGEYNKFNKAMWILYLAAIISCAITIILSFFACLSRLGSIFTSLFALLTALLTIAASAIATAVFLSLKAYISEKLNTYGVSSSIGHDMFVITWLSAGFAVFAWFTWLWTICCCGGGDRKSKRRGGDSYERVDNPYPATGAPVQTAPVPMQRWR